MNIRRLIRFCERIEASGRPEQQYVAEGLRELMGIRSGELTSADGAERVKLLKSAAAEAVEECRVEDERGLFPLHFPEKGFTVELADGSLWRIDEMLWRCRLEKAAPKDADEISFTCENICFDFSAADLKSGEVKVRMEN